MSEDQASTKLNQESLKFKKSLKGKVNTYLVKAKFLRHILLCAILRPTNKGTKINSFKQYNTLFLSKRALLVIHSMRTFSTWYCGVFESQSGQNKK